VRGIRSVDRRSCRRARSKDFVRDVALSRAIAVFSQHGFEGTSTEALLEAMAITPDGGFSA